MRFLLAMMLCLSLMFAAGCGKRCTAAETLSCTTAYSSCTNGCSGDAICAAQCTTSYCDCMDDAGCDKQSQCN